MYTCPVSYLYSAFNCYNKLNVQKVEIIVNFKIKYHIMNWTILIFFGIAVIALIIFLVVRNKKDKEDFEEVLKEDYPKLNE